MKWGKHPTTNIPCPTSNGWHSDIAETLGVGCSMLNVGISHLTTPFVFLVYFVVLNPHFPYERI
jgi:hypothetical protein